MKVSSIVLNVFLVFYLRETFQFFLDYDFSCSFKVKGLKNMSTGVTNQCLLTGVVLNV